MDIEELRELFCVKISLEYSKFKAKMLCNQPEQIYGEAYHVDCIINIYELLLEKSQKIEGKTLLRLLLFPNLLAFCYERWLKQQDSYDKEMEECITESILELKSNYIFEELGGLVA
ncbi:DUF3848 domain-containing protein [[Clostridium] scindens]|uniref:DUF3848 domain-containing protein n=1 Tax=Clostridium scindens (strain JCM 10418 / VPI 12708) TaxID=29347 RepID=UPI0026760275|nr:DUF3848 domain-containing protein [[Clostridium] scindens]